MAGDTIIQTKSPLVKAFNCPSCGGSLKIRAVGQSTVVACQHCDTMIDVQNENYRIIERYEKRMTVHPRIPLGSRGKLRGDIYEVIGFMRRSDSTEAYSWSEYLLFNPYKGFRWLTEAYGHWNFVSMTRTKPKVTDDKAHFLSETYRLYYKGISKVTYVVGEFYWRVAVGSRAKVRDFVCPPRMLSEEKDDDEILWSIGEYVEPEDVRAAFNISTDMPARIGVAPNQPSPVSTSASSLGMYLLYFCCALFLVQFLTLLLAKNQDVYKRSFEYDSTKASQVITTDTFVQPQWRTNLSVTLHSLVQNNWLAVESALVNSETGEAYYFDGGVEFYSGVEDGEVWSEGSQQTSQIISSVPAGSYFLTLEPTSGGLPVGHLFEVTVTRDVPLWWNFLWSLLLILVLPGVALLRMHAFEVRRWSDSDFSPYSTESDS